MTDIKDRLRKFANVFAEVGSDQATERDALAEIERLESERDALKALWKPISEEVVKELLLGTMPALLDCPDDVSETTSGKHGLAERDALQASNERMEAALREAIEFADQDAQALTPIGNAMITRWKQALSTSPHPVETEAERDERRARAINQVLNTLYIGVVPLSLRVARAIAESDKKARQANG